MGILPLGSAARPPAPPLAASTPATTASSVSDPTEPPKAATAASTPPTLSPAEMAAVAREISEALKPVAQSLHFSVDESLGRTVIEVIDSSSHEVIRQIPTEEALRIAKALDKLKGLLLQQRA